MCVLAISHLECTCVSTLGQEGDLFISSYTSCVLVLGRIHSRSHYFINVQGLRGEGMEVKSLQEGDVFNDEICDFWTS